MAYIGSKPTNVPLTSDQIADGTITSNDLVTSGVTAGSYTNASVTVNDKGIVTAASSGAGVSTSQVLSATAGASAGDIGTYAFLRPVNSTNYSANTTLSGSSLRYQGGITRPFQVDEGTRVILSDGNTPAGTWRAMGNRSFAGGSENGFAATLWLRIS